MRIQETNQILKEGKIHRLDHERQEREEGTGSFRERLIGMTGQLGQLLRRSDVRAGLGAAGVALAAVAGAFMKSHQKKHWYQLGR